MHVDVTYAKKCKVLYDKCSKNEDCCSKLCKPFLRFFNGFCDYNKTKLIASNIKFILESGNSSLF